MKTKKKSLKISKIKLNIRNIVIFIINNNYININVIYIINKILNNII